MPRSKYVPYPESNSFDRNKIFPLKDYDQPSIFDILAKSDEEILKHYQRHNLVHQFCPNKMCKKYCSELCLDYSQNKAGTLKCMVCQETYPSRPQAFANLGGDHKFLYASLYAFSLELNLSQTTKLLGISKNGDKAREFRKRMQNVIIKGLDTEDVQLGGGVENPVPVDEMQKGRRRKGNGKQSGHPTRVHGDVFGACDNTRYRFTMQSKESPGPPRVEQFETDLKAWLKPDSVLYGDGAKAYMTFQDKYPELVKYLVRLNHSIGQWTKKVTVEGRKKKSHSQ